MLARVLRIRGRTGLGFIDVWIGLGLLIAYVQIWSLFARVDWVTATAPAAIGVSGLVAARQGNRLRIERRSAVVLGLGLVALLWIANLSLAGPTSYDSGLYHFQAVEYASRFGAVPGLGDLSYRLGAGGAHFLFVALLGQRPWSDAGFHLANGFLVAALLGDLGSRLIGRRSQELISLPFTRLASRLLIPATVVTVASDPGALISSPSIDLPAFVLVAIGMLYVSESVERDLDAESSLAGVASLAAASATRPQFIPATLIALGTVGFVATRPPSGAPRSGVLRTVLFLGAIPTLVMVGWIVRQAVLSGYPLFPSRVVSLPLDWRLPSHTVDEANRYARSWARTPRGLPASVLGSWGWFPGWLSRNGRDINIIGALALLLCAVPVSVLWRVDAQRRERSRAMWAMLGPSLVTLLLWFAIAPDPRFAYAPLWLTPIAVLAHTLPRTRRKSLKLRRRAAALSGFVGITCCYLVVVAVFVGKAYRLEGAGGPGPFGSADPPEPNLVAYETRSGLRLWRPVGDDRCWRTLMCTPNVNRTIRLRGETTGSGFATMR